MSRAAPRPPDAFGLDGWRVEDCGGRRVGKVAAVYAEGDAPAWLLVRLGRYSARYVLTPAADVLSWRGLVALPWERALIERAPLLHAPPATVTEAMATDLRRHFRLAEPADVMMRASRTVV
jgi:hypothetical protein